MASTQLSFALRTSSSVKTVHLLGSWDNYAGQLPLSKKESSKSGSWKGTFKFQGATLQAGQRYWYYYIIDGYHVSHDPAQASTTEPTTGRVLNILDVAKSSSKSSSSSSSSKSSSSKSSKSSSSSKHSSSSSRREARALNTDIPKGRPLSSSQIVSPKPISPHATKVILEESFGKLEAATVGDLTSRFSAATLESDDDEEDYESCPSITSSISSRSSSTVSSTSSMASDCSCERYGITRSGDRIKLDCGGSRCGYSDESCCSSSEDEYVPRSTRRQGIVVRR